MVSIQLARSISFSHLNRAEFHRACGGFLRLLAFIRQFGIVGHIVTVLSRWYQHLLKPHQNYDQSCNIS
ncbi:hypothetical protein V1506DRAFT_545732, partial [Lipomyces tetrasporus]